MMINQQNYKRKRLHSQYYGKGENLTPESSIGDPLQGNSEVNRLYQKNHGQISLVSDFYVV